MHMHIQMLWFVFVDLFPTLSSTKARIAPSPFDEQESAVGHGTSPGTDRKRLESKESKVHRACRVAIYYFESE